MKDDHCDIVKLVPRAEIEDYLACGWVVVDTPPSHYDKHTVLMRKVKK